jgi:hypothetical protein
MKILHVILHVLALIAMVILTVLISTDIHSENKKIVAYLLLIWKGRRDF